MTASTAAQALWSEARAALAHLHDPGYLETHPLGDLRGRALHRALVEAVDALKPPRGGPARTARPHDLLRLRYLEALPVEEVQRRLLIGRSEYYREHERALAALWAVVAPRAGSPTRPEPSASPGDARLPVQLSSFVGRTRELGELRRRLEAGRLLTLVGAGGAGKTRLALELAAAVGGAYADRVWFVDLTPIADGDRVGSGLAARFRLPDQPGRSPVEVLAEYIAGRRVLLVLDNCEHVVAAAAGVVDALLRGCAGLRVLATSREPLGVPGEVVWRVPPLHPDEAARLFAERAAAASAGFALEGGNLSTVGEICRRLDGIPLALELAAARLDVLGLEELAARLGDAFRALGRGSRTAPARHQTLRALLDWSHELLSEPERVLLRRLAVFGGGWTIAAAEGVCSGHDVLPAGEVIEALTGLVAKSLAIAEPHERNEGRYRLLETVRQYAAEQLRAAGEEAALRARHRDWFLAYAESAAGEDERTARPGVGRERANLRAAIEWCIATDDWEPGFRLAAAVWMHWIFEDDRRDTRLWFDRLLAIPGGEAPRALRAMVLASAGTLAVWRSDWEDVEARAAEGEALAARIDDPHSRAWSSWLRAQAARARGDHPGAYVAVGRAIEASRLALASAATSSPRARLMLLTHLRQAGAIAAELGNLDAACGHYEEMRSLAEAWGQHTRVAMATQGLALLAALRGDHAMGERLYAQAVAGHEHLGAPRNAAGVRAERASIRLARGDAGDAADDLVFALRVHHESGEWGPLAPCLETSAALAAAEGRLAHAVRLLGAAEALRERIGVVQPPIQRILLAPQLAALEVLPAAERAAAVAAGRAMNVAQAVAEALEVLALPRVPATTGPVVP